MIRGCGAIYRPATLSTSGHPLGRFAMQIACRAMDGVYLQARMEENAECMLVIIGATPEGKKELLGFQVGLRESAQSPLSWFASKPLSVNGT